MREKEVEQKLVKAVKLAGGFSLTEKKNKTVISFRLSLLCG